MVMYCFPSPRCTAQVANKTEQLVHFCRPFSPGRVWTPVPEKGTGFADGASCHRERVSLPLLFGSLAPGPSPLWEAQPLGLAGQHSRDRPGSTCSPDSALCPARARGLKRLPRGPNPQPRRQGPSGASLARLQPRKRGASGWARRADSTAPRQERGLRSYGRGPRDRHGRSGSSCETPLRAALPGGSRQRPARGPDPAPRAPSVRSPFRGSPLSSPQGCAPGKGERPSAVPFPRHRSRPGRPRPSPRDTAGR